MSPAGLRLASVSRRPQYLELADELAERWSRLPPGSLVDSEHQLATEFDVNRLTAREAVRDLERRMVVRRVMGRGTFTAHRLDYQVHLGGVASFHRNVEALGHRPSTRVVEKTWVGRGAARELRVQRVSRVDDLVASVAVDVFPRHVGEVLDERLVDDASIHDELSAMGFVPRRRSVTVTVAVPPEPMAEHLDFSASPLPSWRLVSETVDAHTGDGVHRSDSWMRTDMFAVTVRLDDLRSS